MHLVKCELFCARYVQRSGKVIILGDAGVGKTALIQK